MITLATILGHHNTKAAITPGLEGVHVHITGARSVILASAQARALADAICSSSALSQGRPAKPGTVMAIIESHDDHGRFTVDLVDDTGLFSVTVQTIDTKAQIVLGEPAANMMAMTLGNAANYQERLVDRNQPRN